MESQQLAKLLQSIQALVSTVIQQQHNDVQQPPVTTSLCTFDVFDKSKETFVQYIKRFEVFTDLNGLTRNKVEPINSDMLQEMTGSEVNDRITSLPIFTCKKCSNTLKLPIILVKGIGNVCGVCSETYNENLRTHNEVLEMVLQNLIIPCKYTKNNCSKKLNYSEMENHELVCNYRDFICPLKMLRNCSWALNLSLIQDHFIKDHKGDIEFKPGPHVNMVVDIAKNYETIKILRNYTNLFILYLHCNIDDSVLRCTLYQIKNEKGFLERNYTVIYNDSCYIGNVITLAEDKGFTGYFNSDQVLVVDLPKNSKATTGISVEINDKNVPSPTTDGRLLKAFECPICNNFMKPPILQCLRGHSVCNICKVKLHNCPTCRERFGETRNYALEHLHHDLHFPCMYRAQGCNVIETGEGITKHEQECPLLVYRCPTCNGCTWTGIYDNMLDHILTHSNTVKSSFYLGKINLNNEKLTFYMIAYDRLFCASIDFSLYRTYSGNEYHTFWIVRLIGPKHEAKLFKYEFGLIRSNPIDNKHTFSNICQEYPENPHNTHSGSVEIPDKIIQQFKIDGEVSFYCRIVKIVETDLKRTLRNWLVNETHRAPLYPV